MKQLLEPSNVKKSIREALYLTRDCNEAIHRVRSIIAKLPDGTMYYKSEKKRVKFFRNCFGEKSYLLKNSDILYDMCRKRYLVLLLHALELRNMLFSPRVECSRSVAAISKEFDRTVESLMSLLDVYIHGNLDIARIVLTQKQYRWYSSEYQKKPLSDDAGQWTNRGVHVHSKSEKILGNHYEDYAVPYHNDSLMILNVAKVIKEFEEKLRDSGQITGALCYLKNWTCYWNVPPEYQGMNKHGSIWRAYNPVKGKIRIFNDFHIMLADGELVVHEHEGLAEDFDYRRNASERVYVMRLTGAASSRNLITTLEQDVNGFDKIIRERILSRLWF